MVIDRILLLFGVYSSILVSSSTTICPQPTLAEQLRTLETRVLTGRSAEKLENMLAQHARKGLIHANHRSSREWASISGLRAWAAYAGSRLEALQESLGDYPHPTGPPRIEVSRTLEGDGFKILNLVFESRPGIWVTANLYIPDPLRDSMPGIILCHSHHNPKSQGELQDMGMNWARLGCQVLVMDQLGHGERSDHPFHSAKDHPVEFRVGRQDYYFRYNLGIQLHLIGDSLIGWMVYDLRRAVDFLLSREGIDPGRIIMMGSVAGGGNPVAVAAALDKRITAAVPFNFGGPEPESEYPLPEDAEDTFNYAGTGSWESTRNLRLSCRDGFLPWLIVAGTAPRRLIYAHEFSWDRDHDPVWKRLKRVYGDFYRVPDRLDFTHGFGLLRQRPPQASHCNNIGPFHRKRIYRALQNWFGIPIPESEYSQRRDRDELRCFTDVLLRRLQPRKVYETAARIGQARSRKVHDELWALDPGARRKRLRSIWRELLGQVDPLPPARLLHQSRQETASGLWVEKSALETEPGILVPFLLVGHLQSRGAQPLVIGVAQEGKAKFLKEHVELLEELLTRQAAVCLVDVRGTGETAPAGGRGRTSRSTAISSTELMLGQTQVGSRLRDLRSVLLYLEKHPRLDPNRFAILGDSFAPANSTGTNLQVPMGIEREPALSEPLGGLLALLVGLFEDDVKAVYVGHGLSSYASLLSSPFCYLPYDAVVPGAVAAGDLPELAAAFAPRPLRMERLVNGQNVEIAESQVRTAYRSALEAYRNHPRRLVLKTEPTNAKALANWLLECLQ